VVKAKTVQWRDVQPAAVILVSGPEEFIANRVIKKIKSELLLQNPGLETHEITASEYVSGEIFTLTSPSLFLEPRLLIVQGVEKCSDALIEDGVSYLLEPVLDTTVIFRHNSSSVRGKKLIEAIRSNSAAVETICTEIKKDSERASFINSEMASEGRKITPGAVRALADAFSDDISELASACKQLLSDQGEVIDEDTVDKYYGGRVETNAFKVADAALAGQSAEALALLRHALSTGGDPVPMVAAFGMKVRLMAKVFGNRYASPSTLGVQSWQIDRARRDLSGWDEDGLAEAVKAIASTDAAVKGMERDPVFALERLVLLLANRGQKKTEA
jgi:DNA polymerase III subunit delta